MSGKNKLVVTTPSDREILMVREFDAPRALVWDMFTRPEHVRQWWGYKHLEVTVCEIDLRVGGEYRYVGRRSDGNLCPFKGVHHEIVYPEKIVFTEIFDVDMAREHPSLVTTTFTEADGKTTVRVLISYDSKQTRDMVIGTGMESGAAASYDQLEELLAARKPGIVITREFAAPRALVWSAWTDPAQFARWYGPRGFTIPRIELDVRAGGAIRCDMRGPNTPVMTTLGTFTDVVAQARLGFTLRVEQDGMVTFEMLHLVTLAEVGDRTRLTLEVHVLRPAGATKDMLGGAERGWTQAFDKLGELVAR